MTEVFVEQPLALPGSANNNINLGLESKLDFSRDKMSTECFGCDCRIMVAVQCIA